MEEAKNPEVFSNIKRIRGEHIKKWDHIPVRPDVFANFRRLKADYESDNVFVMELLRVYENRMIFLEKRRRLAAEGGK